MSETDGDAIIGSETDTDTDTSDFDFSDVSRSDVSIVDSTFDEHDILPGRSLSDARLLELRAQIANFEAPDRNSEPLTDSEDSEGEQEAQLQAQLESEDIPQVTLTDQQIDFLKTRLGEFKKADLAGKRDIIIERAETLEKSWRQEYGAFIRKPVEDSIRQYLFNASKRRPKRSDFNPRKNHTARDVLIHHHRDRITAIACRMSKSRPGSREYIKFYSKAVDRMRMRLSKKTLVRYEAEAKRWTAEKPSRSQQCHTFGKHGVKSLRKFAKSSYREFGVRMVIFAGYQQTPEDANPTISCFDFNDDIGGGTSFESSHQNWHEEAIFQDFSDWVIESFGGSLGNGSKGAPPNADKVPEIELETDYDGYPLLPSWEDVKIWKLPLKKTLISKFMGGMYELSTGRRNAKVPWSKLQDSPTDFINMKYLPEEARLTQCHHMRLDDVDALLEHWTNRQAAGKKPFRFKNLKHTARRGKKAASDEDEDDGEDINEEDQQRAEGSNQQGPRRSKRQKGNPRNNEEQRDFGEPRGDNDNVPGEGDSSPDNHLSDTSSSQGLPGSNQQRSNSQDDEEQREYDDPRGDDDKAPGEGDSPPDNPLGDTGSSQRPRARRVQPAGTLGNPSTNTNVSPQPNQTLGGPSAAEPSNEESGDTANPPQSHSQSATDQRQGSPAAAPGTNADMQEDENRRSGDRTRTRSDTATGDRPGKRQRREVNNARRSDRGPKPSRRALGQL